MNGSILFYSIWKGNLQLLGIGFDSYTREGGHCYVNYLKVVTIIDIPKHTATTLT